MSGDEDDCEYDYSDEEDYDLEEDDDEMDWNPSATIASENPNAAPTMSGKYCTVL